METQINTFSEGLTSDVSPLYVKNTQWTFPTVNVRFIITKDGLSAVNVEGNTNSNNPDGEEFFLESGYHLIGAYSTMGIGFFFSVSQDEKKIEIGTFPSYDDGNVVREYRPLVNIKDGQIFDIDNIYEWDVNHLLQVEGSVEYDGTLNMYICSGKDLLRCVNSGFSLYDGEVITQRHYDLSSINEQTMVLSMPNESVLRYSTDKSNYSVVAGGNVPYATYLIYLRMVDFYKNVTPWIYEIGPIIVSAKAHDSFDIGELWDAKSDKKIDLSFKASLAYDEVEVGIVVYSDKGLGSTDLQYQGILTNKFKIYSDEMRISITNLSADVLEAWDVLETQKKMIEAIPKTIATIDNRLWQANLIETLMPLDVIREFCEKIKLRCVVDPKLQKMPTDTDDVSNVQFQQKYLSLLRRRYYEIVVKQTTDYYERYYYNDREDGEDDVIESDEKLWEVADVWNTANRIIPTDDYSVYLKLNVIQNNAAVDRNITLRFADPNIAGNIDYSTDGSKLREFWRLEVVPDDVTDTEMDDFEFYITVDHKRNNMDSDVIHQYTPLIRIKDTTTGNEFYYGNVLQIDKTLTLMNNEDIGDNISGFPVGESDDNTITLVNPTYAKVNMKLLPDDGDDPTKIGVYMDYEDYYVPMIVQYWGWLEYGQQPNQYYDGIVDNYLLLRLYDLKKAEQLIEDNGDIDIDDVLWLLEGNLLVGDEQKNAERYDYSGDTILYLTERANGLGWIINKYSDITVYSSDYNRGVEDNGNFKMPALILSQKSIFQNDIVATNDAYYSNSDHIFDDVGYFGGEVYAFSVVATDTFGNTLGAFSPVGIDHYYANNLNDLRYGINDEAFDSSTWELNPDTMSAYGKPFAKNNKGIYRFPSRSNYTPVLDINGDLKYDEESYVSMESGKGYHEAFNDINITELQKRDPFNLTHRIHVKSVVGSSEWELMLDGSHKFVNTLNIFKIAFDFTEAWKWARANGYEDLIKKKIVSFRFLRAERNENLQTQGIIQKPNTIVPYPKYYDLETGSMSNKMTSIGQLSHESYCRLISYNFDYIRMPYDVNAQHEKGNGINTFRCRGQMVNSSIKYFDSLWEYYNRGINKGGGGLDMIYPYVYGEGIINSLQPTGVIGTMRGGKAITDSYTRNIDPRGFVFSGKWMFDETSYKWDISDTIVQEASPRHNQPTTPGLGGVGYMNIVNYTGTEYDEPYPHAHYRSMSDLLWGEMSFPIINVMRTAPDKYYQQKFRFPYPDVFFDHRNNANATLSWYKDDKDINSTSVDQNAGQFLHPQTSSQMGERALMKIPFFKGNMPCMSVGNRQLTKSKNRSTRYYTSRCMYHPYDKTRAFFSIDNVMSNMDVNLRNYKFIKPIRKTIYSGENGWKAFPKGRRSSPFIDGMIREDGWKTFFIKPSKSQLTGRQMSYRYDENFTSFYGYSPNVYIYPFHIKIDYEDSSDIHNATSHKGAIGATPSGVLHSIRKYLKVEDPREICAIGDGHIVSPYEGTGIGVSERFLPGVVKDKIHIGSSKIDIRAHENNKDAYIAGAYDFYGINAMSEIWGTAGKFENNKITGLDGFSLGKGNHPMLFCTLDVNTTNKQGQYMCSNRNFQFADYIALSLNTTGKTAPSSLSGYNDYNTYLDRLSNKYILLTRKDMETEYKNKAKNKWAVADGGRYADLSQAEFNDLFSISTDNRTEPKYNNQYSALDVHIDTNYEDLTICNIYKEDPENIVDITNFYNIHGIAYYEIGKIDSLRSVTDKEIVLARGDCFLDRTYFKHTTWRDDNNTRKVFQGGDDDGSQKEGDHISLFSNIGITGSADDGKKKYACLKANANLMYAHGVVLGLITENKYNIALRGNLELVSSNDGTYNYYPLSNLAENNSSVEVTDIYLKTAKNAFVLYPATTHAGKPLIEDKTMNFSYNRTLGNIAYFLSDSALSDLRTSRRTRVRWSSKKIEGSYADGWKEWNYADFIDFSQKYGEIKRLIVFNDTLFSFLDDAYFQHIFLGEQVQVTDEQYLTVGGTRILSDQVGVSENYGLSHSFGIIKTDAYIYAADLNRDLLYRVGTQKEMNGRMAITAPENILKSLGINMYAKEYFSTIRRVLFSNIEKVSDRSSKLPDTPYLGNGIVLGYDRKYNEVLYSFRWKGESGIVEGDTLVLSELLGCFTSFYTMNPYMFASINDDLYSVTNSRGGVIDSMLSSKGYKHNNEHSPKQVFYNKRPSPFEISFYVNGTTEEANMGMLMKQFESLSIESQQEPFTGLIFTTKDQESINNFIDEDHYWTVPEYLSHHWQVPIRLDNTSILDGNANYEDDYYYRDSSMVGDWLKVTIQYIPGVASTIKDIFITTVLTSFSLSKA